jgi:type IV pilus assembly protein PilW
MKILSSAPPWVSRSISTVPQSARYQQGVTLLELLIGITIGLLVVAVATSALMVSRGVSGTVSDASIIQQQAAYAMRVIGLQLRQAGSLYLNPNPTGITSEKNYMQPVAFEAQAINLTEPTESFDPAKNTISATTNSLLTGFSRYKDQVYGSATETSLMRNCLGGPKDESTSFIIQSEFKFDDTKLELRCNGNSAGEQPILQNVAEFQWRYLVQDIPVTNPGAATIQYTSTAPTDLNKIQAIEVCLVLFGAETIDMPAGSKYTGCAQETDGTDKKVDMTSLTGTRKNRMHMRFRNVFQIRSQGTTTPPI